MKTFIDLNGLPENLPFVEGNGSIAGKTKHNKTNSVRLEDGTTIQVPTRERFNEKIDSAIEAEKNRSKERKEN